jgi:serine/threonine-protein kinase HipA
MICWFAHLLPQGPLRRLIAREHDIDPIEDFEVLLACGEDLPGAVRVTELLDHVSTPIEPPATRRLALAFSLAGAQWKLSVREGERGLVAPVSGSTGTWVAKFHDPEHPSLPEVEHATLGWAKRAGIEVPVFRLVTVDEFESLPEGVPTGDGKVLLSQRFDRRGGRRIHMEDFGQILDRPPGEPQYHGSHEEVAVALKHVCKEPQRDLQELTARIVFNVLAGNGDAHLKNWAILYPDDRHAVLAPAYDLVPTIVYRPKDDLALTLGGNRAFDSVAPNSFEELARSCDLEATDVSRWVTDAADQVREAWLSARSDFESGDRLRIEQHMRRIKLPR